jgi:hypothetical protein
MKDQIPPPAIVRQHADLRLLAQQINAAHKAGEEATRRGLEHFRAAGEALLAVKAQLGHGGFQAWVEQHLNCSYRTAARYMRLAREWGKCNTVTHLPEAMRVLSDDAEETEGEAPVPLPSPDDAAHGGADGSEDPDAEPPPPADDAAPPPPSPLPDRVRPYFEHADLFDLAARQALAASSTFHALEESPAFKKSVEDKPYTLYWTTFRTAARTVGLLKPVRPCPDGCAAVEPSLDTNPCKACQGKGYQTVEDVENAEAAK